MTSLRLHETNSFQLPKEEQRQQKSENIWRYFSMLDCFKEAALGTAVVYFPIAAGTQRPLEFPSPCLHKYNFDCMK